MREIIEQTLHNLSITRNYRGYRCILIAVELILEDEDRMVNMVQDLYVPTARELHCNVHSIERNIRTVINHVWHTNRKLLVKMSGYDLNAPPNVGTFLDIIVNHVMRTCRLHTK